MAYCRNTGINSEVYLFKGFDNKFYFHIISKTTSKLVSFSKDTTKEALKKLKRLRNQGYKIPDYAIEQLTKESKDEI